MKKNVGIYDALIRITFGMVGLAYCVAYASQRKYRFPWTLAFLSSMKIAEGIVRYCPILDVLGKYSKGRSLSASSIINEITNQ